MIWIQLPFSKLVNFILLYFIIKEGNKVRRKQYVGRQKFFKKDLSIRLYFFLKKGLKRNGIFQVRKVVVAE